MRSSVGELGPSQELTFLHARGEVHSLAAFFCLGTLPFGKSPCRRKLVTFDQTGAAPSAMHLGKLQESFDFTLAHAGMRANNCESVTYLDGNPGKRLRQYPILLR